jgi:hypothetical protein
MDFNSTQQKKLGGHQEAVIVRLEITEVPEEFWELNKRLFEDLEGSGAGEFDGNEIGDDDATLFAYGPDANRLFSIMRPILGSYAFCRNARVSLRRGGPGSSETEVQL